MKNSALLILSLGYGVGMEHIDALQLRLSNERIRLQSATSKNEIALRKAWIAQIEKEIKSEERFTDISSMGDDQLLNDLLDS